MARKSRTIQISGLNIVIHPHSPEMYVGLLTDAFRSLRIVNARGHQALMMGSLYPIDSDNPLSGLRGSIYRFLRVDKDAPWFNVVTRKNATEEDVSNIHIPDHLRPNTETFDFIFYPKAHTLYFNRVSTVIINKRRPIITPGPVAKMFELIFKVEGILKKYGDVEVHVLPDFENLGKILGMHSLRRISLDITAPNAPDLSKAQQKVYARMNKLNIRRQIREYYSEKHESMQLDENTITLANIAAVNGSVKASGYDERGIAVQMSTTEKPWMKKVIFNENQQSEFEALAANTENLPGRDAETN